MANPCQAYPHQMIITLYSNTYKPFSHGYPKFIQVQRVHDPQQTGSPIHAISKFNQNCTKRGGFDSVGDFDFKIPSPIAGEPNL